jgi:hypothetical protein
MPTHTPTQSIKSNQGKEGKEIETFVVAYPITLMSKTPLGGGYPHAQV